MSNSSPILFNQPWAACRILMAWPWNLRLSKKKQVRLVVQFVFMIVNIFFIGLSLTAN